MDDEEDDVFEPDSLSWRTIFREVKYEHRGTQTPGPALESPSGMLPCSDQPRPLFYGNAGFRLHFPAHSERVVAPAAGRGEEGPGDMELQQDSMEARVGHKLQLIGDQFHQEHLHMYHRNQRNQGAVWWRMASALLSLLLERDPRGRR
ncbi:BCL2 modifying factor 1 [Osmerus eperlanus]|uniref:BCL2 modifying factor 1 n=1 Tax=Osmerus eperlanus TaxID=29151 RepID=UPI002E10BFF5